MLLIRSSVYYNEAGYSNQEGYDDEQLQDQVANACHGHGGARLFYFTRCGDQFKKSWTADNKSDTIETLCV